MDKSNNDILEKTLQNLEVFFAGDIKNTNDIFKGLGKILSFKSGLIYFLTPEKLRLEYSFNCKNAPKEIPIDNTEKKFLYNPDCKISNDKLNIFDKYQIAEHLKIHKSVYGILIITSDKPFSEKTRKTFHLISQIISNIIKDLELSQIMKMQTEALQKGLIETEKAYKIIKKQNKKILETDKIKNRFLSNVSHELRTPLNSIIGFSELLQNPKLGNLNEKQLEYIKDIQTSGINLLAMINEVLDISKLESGTMSLNLKRFEISNCITETINILTPLLAKKNITLKIDTNNTQITADYTKLQQILFNLINNAIKFSPQNETIEIHTKQKRKYIEIRIKDNGCGIEKKFHKKIFKKFEQINQTQNSTGLGLTITKELVLMHKGKISLVSEKDKGAEFIINLPI